MIRFKAILLYVGRRGQVVLLRGLLCRDLMCERVGHVVVGCTKSLLVSEDALMAQALAAARGVFLSDDAEF